MQEALPAHAHFTRKGLVAKTVLELVQRWCDSCKALTKVKPIAKHVGAEVVNGSVHRSSSDNDNTNDRVNTSGY